MEFHKISEIFPLMEGAEFESLVEDIKEQGLLEPICLYESKILDGRNRYRACEKAGVEPRFTEWVEGKPVEFVISKNLKRRHLNESQRAVIASSLANMPQGGRTDLPPIGGRLSQTEVAKLLNISERTVQRVKAVERDAPELLSQIKSGKITVNEAEKKIKTKKRAQERSELAMSGEDVKPSSRWNIYHDDMETIELNKQYDFIITDPPYPKEYLPLYEILAKRAVEWLKPGGLLIAMCGQSYLNQIYQAFDKHLSYYWTACYLTPSQPTPLRQRQINTTWKPVLIYTRQDCRDYKGKTFGDVFTSQKPDKAHHEWGQSVSGMLEIVKQICLPGQSILDPFCGAGTTGVAALQRGCLFDGIEKDRESVNISKRRCGDETEVRSKIH